MEQVFFSEQGRMGTGREVRLHFQVSKWVLLSAE